MFEEHMYGDLSESYLKYTAYARQKRVADLALSNDLQDFSQLPGFYDYMVSSRPNQNFHKISGTATGIVEKYRIYSNGRRGRYQNVAIY